ncbi:MAG TPA: hypothetical protein VFZ58_02470 [Candidatus Saccharimonadales bacterium]
MGLRFQHESAASHYIIIASAFICILALVFISQVVSSSPIHALNPKEAASVLVAPTLTAPSDNAIKNGTLLRYSWQPVEGADCYVYESYTNAEMTELHERQTVEATIFERSEQHEAEIWWRVKALTTAGEAGAWSEHYRVIIDNLAPSIKHVTEGDVSKVSGVATFKFEVSDGYPDKIIASMDGEPTQINQTSDESTANSRAQKVTVHITFTIDTLQLSDGPHALKVRAVDHAGNLSDALELHFMVTNAPPAPEKPVQQPVNAPPIEAIQTIPLPQAPPIAPILGGEQVTADIIAADNSAVTHAETKTIQETAPINTHNHPVEKAPHVNFSWPMWLGLGALLSGTSWWMVSGRRRV